MRVLCVAAPGSGLFLPTVPLAWAMRAAGHDVFIVNNGAAARTLAASGFTTVDPCPDTDVLGEFMRASRLVAGLAPGAERPARAGMGIFGEDMAEGLLRLADAVRPDLVVSTLEQGAGPIIAAARGIPYVEQGVRLAWTAGSEQAVRYRDAVRDYLAPTRARLGVGPVPRPAAVIDVAPPSLVDTPLPHRWLMRYVPYNEGRVVPEWVLTPSERPRVCVTMGSVLGAGATGPAQQMLFALVHAVLARLGELDIEVVLAMGDLPLEEATLPANVRVGGWLPLDLLLPGCAAIIHHGGSGTSLTALAAGVPQLVLPRAADQPENAAVLAAGGVGLAVGPEEITPEAIGAGLERLLAEPAFGKATTAVREEMRALPSPAEIADRLADLVA